MIYIVLNFVPIFAATVLGFAFGLGWYQVFGREERPGLPALAGVFAAEFWVASILAGALILAPEEAGAWTMAVGTAVVIWVGFILPALFVTDVYGRRPLSETLRHGGHWLAAALLNVLVLEGLGLTPPPSAAG